MSEKTMLDNKMAESKENDKKELADIETLKKTKVDGATYNKNAKKIIIHLTYKGEQGLEIQRS